MFDVQPQITRWARRRHDPPSMAVILALEPCGNNTLDRLAKKLTGQNRGTPSTRALLTIPRPYSSPPPIPISQHPSNSRMQLTPRAKSVTTIHPTTSSTPHRPTFRTTPQSRRKTKSTPAPISQLLPEVFNSCLEIHPRISTILGNEQMYTMLIGPHLPFSK